MKKNIWQPLGFIALICLVGIYSCSYNTFLNCYFDLNRAYEISGISFPLQLSNYSVRAKSGMVEVTYPIDETRCVILRKALTFKGHDISGVETKFPMERDSYLANGVAVKIKEDDEKVYVLNLAASTGYYSVYCEQGLCKEEVEGIYRLLAETEAQKPVVPSTL